MQTSISKTNFLFDSIFEPTRSSTSTFLINDNKEISYMDFHIMINQLANVLIKKGMRAGDRVAVQAEKSNTQIALYAATIKAGGVYLPLNTGYTSSELDYFIKDSSAKIIIVDKNVENIIAKRLSSTGEISFEYFDNNNISSIDLNNLYRDRNEELLMRSIWDINIPKKDTIKLNKQKKVRLIQTNF